MVASLCKQYGIDIPVVITTGPEGSTTANIIPDIVRQYNHFGLKNIKVLPQDERLFLSTNEKIVQIERDGVIRPVTHPDETGGPIMKLKKKGTISQNKSVLDWFTGLGCHSTLIVQATALYHKSLLPLMAASIGTHDCLGVGILRSEFPENDPYGTYVTLSGNNGKRTVILEQDVRNDITLTVKDSSNRFYLPFNTGFYAFNNNLLQENNLPDFATPPKEIHPDLPRTPKIGYAAIDLIALARNPLILAINSNMFGVLKSADDLERLAVLGKQFNLDRLCADFSQ
jgi:hypothetical protein